MLVFDKAYYLNTRDETGSSLTIGVTKRAAIIYWKNGALYVHMIIYG